jgi:hypothetical protein
VADLPWGEHFHVSLVAEEVPLSMRPKWQVRDTPQVHWQGLGQIALPGISKAANPLKYWVAILYIIVKKRCCDSPCLSKLKKHM